MVVSGCSSCEGVLIFIAWIMPFAVSAAALIGTILLVRHWARNQAQTTPADNAMQIPAESEMQERIRRETGTD